MFRATNNLLEYTPHGDQNGYVGVTKIVIPHKSTTFGTFLDFKIFISCFDRVLLLRNISTNNK